MGITEELFIRFPKIARLNRDIIITEKIDGTNSSIAITESGKFLIGSRSRWITPEDDNHGFATWCMQNKDELMKLGVGRHFGEWWGKGIQRGYGIGEKRFSLFNVTRWCPYGVEPRQISSMEFRDPKSEVKFQEVLPECVSLVPELYMGKFGTEVCENFVSNLKTTGSQASPGFMDPEGIVIFHVGLGYLFKVTCQNDEKPKGLAATDCV